MTMPETTKIEQQQAWERLQAWARGQRYDARGRARYDVQAGLSGEAKRILEELAFKGVPDDAGVFTARPSVGWLAERCNYSPNRVRRALRELVDVKCISGEPQVGDEWIWTLHPGVTVPKASRTRKRKAPSKKRTPSTMEGVSTPATSSTVEEGASMAEPLPPRGGTPSTMGDGGLPPWRATPSTMEARGKEGPLKVQEGQGQPPPPVSHTSSFPDDKRTASRGATVLTVPVRDAGRNHTWKAGTFTVTADQLEAWGKQYRTLGDYPAGGIGGVRMVLNLVQRHYAHAGAVMQLKRREDFLGQLHRQWLGEEEHKLARKLKRMGAQGALPGTGTEG